MLRSFATAQASGWSGASAPPLGRAALGEGARITLEARMIPIRRPLWLRGHDPDAESAGAESLDALDGCLASSHLDSVAGASDDAAAVVKQLHPVSGDAARVAVRPHYGIRRVWPGLKREPRIGVRDEATLCAGEMAERVPLCVWHQWRGCPDGNQVTCDQAAAASKTMTANVIPVATAARAPCLVMPKTVRPSR